MKRAALFLSLLLSYGLTAANVARGAEFTPGKARWIIKTTVLDEANVEQGKFVAYDDLVKLANPQDVKRNDSRFQETRIPAFENTLEVKEGDILTTRAWLHLVAPEDDGDYHIQISGSRDSQESCMVVEVPVPDERFVSSDTLRPHVKQVREFVDKRLLAGKPSNHPGSKRKMMHPPFVEVTGQLFYDDAHVRKGRDTRRAKSP
jgi:hypothetical protein